jgi:hypothetical protein
MGFCKNSDFLPYVYNALCIFPIVGLNDVSTISLTFPSPMGDIEETISSSNEYNTGKLFFVGDTY